MKKKQDKTVTLTATFKPADANEELIWTSSNPKIATVKNGVVTSAFNKTGTTIITAQKGSKTATCKVTVVVPVKSLKLDKTSVAIDGGSTVKLTAKYSPKETSDELEWTVSNPDIATLESKKDYCKVTLWRKGAVTVTATMGSQTATCKIKSLNDGAYKINYGDKLDLAKSVQASGATWRSGDTSVAIVSKKGVVTSTGGGSTTITRKENGETYQYVVTVKVTPITLNVSKMHVFVCNQAKFNSEKLKVKKYTDNITFKSSNPKIASVNANGKVTAKSPGTATITATRLGATATCDVTVSTFAYGTVKGSVTTLSGYRGGYEPEYAAIIYAYDFYDETRHYRFVQNNQPTYSIKLPVGAYYLEFSSGNCSDGKTVYVRANKTTTYNARLN